LGDLPEMTHLPIKNIQRLDYRGMNMKHSIARSLVFLLFAAAIMSVAPSARAQLACTGSNPGYGDQVWGTTFGPTELTSACGVTAVGYQSLVNDTGNWNTAVGVNGLYANTSGTNNTAMGSNALLHNTTGYDNGAVGVNALDSNTTGYENTADGFGALDSNTTGLRNNAFGAHALFVNTTASDNNAMGAFALSLNTTGTLNSAVGNFALEDNTTGNNNNAVGYGALLSNTTGADNNAQGYEALYSNTTGNLNIAIGYESGISQTTGSQNIYINNSGIAAESNVIRIGSSSGTSTQTSAYIAGIFGVNVTGGASVVVSSNGQLGVVSSSVRYKEDIQPLGEASDRLLKLRPVSFRYKEPSADGSKPVQYGLVAEEVAETLPELVVYGADGRPESVSYHVLPTLLLNEYQKQQQTLLAMERSNERQTETIATQAAEIQDLKQQQVRIEATLQKLEAR
jgi:hypothetical protein